MSVISWNRKDYTEQQPIAVEVDLGEQELTVTTEPVESGIQKVGYGRDITSDFTFPSGAYNGEIVHNDFTGGTIIVNGKILEYGDRYPFQAIYNHVSQKQDFAPAIEVSANGKKWDYGIIYPSDSIVDVSNFP